jgi:hypothetical protein
MLETGSDSFRFYEVSDKLNTELPGLATERVKCNKIVK